LQLVLLLAQLINQVYRAAMSAAIASPIVDLPAALADLKPCALEYPQH